MKREREILFYRKRHMGSTYYWPLSAKGLAVTVGSLAAFGGGLFGLNAVGTWVGVPSQVLNVAMIVIFVTGILTLLALAHAHSQEVSEHW